MPNHQKQISTPNFDRINPSSCINAKLRRLHRLINSAYQAKINPFGLRGSMLSILFIIGKNEGISQKMIADILVLDASTMSRDIKKLIDKGWVLRTQGTDARQAELSLSQTGFELLEEVSPVWESLHQTVEGILGSFNIQQIDAITSAIQSSLPQLRA